MNTHHRIALASVTIAALLVGVFGGAFAHYEHLPLIHGLYIALANAATIGGDIQPRSTAGYVINAIEAVTVVPLFGVSVGFFTSGLAAIHVHRAKEELKQTVADATGPKDEK